MIKYTTIKISYTDLKISTNTIYRKLNYKLNSIPDIIVLPLPTLSPSAEIEEICLKYPGIKEYMRNSIEITLEEVEGWSFGRKLVNNTIAMLGPLL